jgi:hypothetical protein
MSDVTLSPDVPVIGGPAGVVLPCSPTRAAHGRPRTRRFLRYIGESFLSAARLSSTLSARPTRSRSGRFLRKPGGTFHQRQADGLFLPKTCGWPYGYQVVRSSSTTCRSRTRARTA